MRRFSPGRSRLGLPAKRTAGSRRSRGSGRPAPTSRPQRRDRRATARLAAAPVANRPIRTVHPSALARVTLTGRAAVLGVVVCMLVFALAYPVRSFLSQRSHIRSLTSQNAHDQQRVADLQRTIDRYQDPAYIEQLARTRLHYQRPGETVYLLPPAAPQAPVHQREGHANVQVSPEKAWYDQLWTSAVQSGK